MALKNSRKQNYPEWYQSVVAEADMAENSVSPGHGSGHGSMYVAGSYRIDADTVGCPGSGYSADPSCQSVLGGYIEAVAYGEVGGIHRGYQA